jgi:5'-3' exonuclease
MTDSQNSRSLLLIDSFALLFRGFFATASVGNYMQNSQGLYTNGLHQFTRYMLDAIRTFQPTHVACAFDMGKSTFRNEMYAQYKANRNEPPLELIPQFDKLWELVEAFDIPSLGVEGYEADDVIGTIAKRYSAEGIKVRILTGDGDALQLINENTQVVLLKKGFGNYETVGLDNLYELRGIELPSQIIELKALMGDSSDNIPGCPNVGPKTAMKLIAEYGNVDRIFDHIEDIKGKLGERLLEHKELIYLSRDLASIRTDIEIDCTLEDCIYQWNRDKLVSKLEEFEMKAMIRSVAG